MWKASNAQTIPDMEKHQFPGNGTKNSIKGKNWSFNIYIPQAQDLLSSTWDVVRKELGFK